MENGVQGAVVALTDDRDAITHQQCGANALPDDTCKDAVNLNNLDDWKEFHEAVLK